MARYPTFEEYDKRKNYTEGIKRCDEILARNPRDVQLLVTKLRLQVAAEQSITPTIEALQALQPPIQDTQLLVAIEEAVVESQRDIHPRSATAGAAMTTLYSNAQKSLTSEAQKIDLQRVRFTTAIYDDRLVDAQQALIQLKAMQPKNRVLYMAHAAVTQLLSSSNEDLQARLALSLARKAVKDGFDVDEGLDCRVPGQILAVQGCKDEVKALKGKFADSKQVFDLLKAAKTEGGNGAAATEASSATMTAVENLAQEVEMLKRKFGELVQSAAETAAIISFAVEAISTFQSAMKTVGKGKQGRITVDASLLSVSALVRAFQLSTRSAYLLLAAFVAEALLQHDPHVHEARLILVYLYMRLGLGSLAIRFFDSLNVREIQHDTVGHVLLTQISYTHPHKTPVSRRDNFEPMRRASLALAVYVRCEEKLAETEAGILNHGQTGMIFDVHALRRQLRSSLARRLILLEQRRLARLTQTKAGEEVAALGPRVAPTWLEYSDNRDFNATFDAGLNVEKVLYGEAASSPGTTRKWILYSLIVDTAWCMAMDFPLLIRDVEVLLQEYEKSDGDIKDLSIADADTTSSSRSTQLQSPYHLAGRLAYQLLTILVAVKRPGLLPDISVSDTISNISHALSNLDVEALTAKPPSGLCDDIKAVNTYLDVLRLTVRVCEVVLDTDSSALREVQEKARSNFVALQIYARGRVKDVSAAKVKAELESEADVWSAVETLHGDQGKEFCETVAEAAKSGWEGLGYIQLV